MTITRTSAAPRITALSLQHWLAPGLIAGTVFLAFEMLAGAFTTSPWAFPEAIPQTIGIAAPTLDLEPVPLLLGVVLHLAFSIGVGALFIGLADTFRVSAPKLLAAGVLLMWAESAVSIWLVLHTLFPSTLPILFAAVPFWASFVGRMAFGLSLAATYLRMRRGRPFSARLRI